MAVPERRDVRVGDDERQAVVDQLRVHLGAGRLELDEFEERAAQALAARTVGDLVPLTADLPVVRSRQKGPPIRQQSPLTAWDKALRLHAVLAGAIALLLIVLWGFTFAWGLWLAALIVLLTVGVHAMAKHAFEA